MNIAIIGGGAAGFFCAVAIKELHPSHSVTIYESGSKPLRKVKVSGGGRCNLSNSFANVKDLKNVYPRGHRLMKRLFKSFSPEDAQQWWRNHGVELTVQDDDCIFPKTQNSQTIIDTLLLNARRLGVKVVYGTRIESIAALTKTYDAVCVTVGGLHQGALYKELADLGHEMVEPVPSLFTFNIEDESLRSLMGLVVEGVELKIPGTKFRAEGTLLITHWGVSGPVTLKLSSYAARHLAEKGYACPLSINWSNAPQLQSRLRKHLLERAGIEANKQTLSKKEQNRLSEVLTNDTYEITSRCKFKDEFVTAGGVSLTAVSANTLESKSLPGLYFAGEVLDIDGITGGFNFQACWTTAMTVARAITTYPSIP